MAFQTRESLIPSKGIIILGHRMKKGFISQWSSLFICFLLLKNHLGHAFIIDVRSASQNRFPTLTSSNSIFPKHHRSFPNPLFKNQNSFVVVSKSNGYLPRKRCSSSLLHMSLLPIPVPVLNRLLTTAVPTPAQYSTYWGVTTREKYNAIFEACGVGFLGVFAAYFFSFVVGQFVATILGVIAAFWIIISPELKAYQRNWELRGGRDLVDPWMFNDDEYYDEEVSGLFGAYYFGRVDDVSIVEDPSDGPRGEYSLDHPKFQDYTMETDQLERITGIPYQLRFRVTDSGGRTLQVHTRMSEEYLDIEPGMPVSAVLLSTSVDFDVLASMTDFCIPDAECWVGDYPYLDRAMFERELVEDSRLWNQFKKEGRGEWGFNHSENDYDLDDTYDDDNTVTENL